MAKHNESPKKEKSESELEEKIIHINRCSKVVKGGRKFSFSVLIAVGDRKGRVGYGFAKANELTDAIRKAGESARNKLVVVPAHKSTIPHEERSKFDGANILFKPAPEGTGVVAGSKVRAILELAGIKNVMAKNLGARNPINQVKAVFKAIGNLTTRAEIKQRRS